jgi:hypothetical protein
MAADLAALRRPLRAARMPPVSVPATMALMGTAMANDSGAASSEAHVSLMGGVLGGQVVAGLAGIPGGLAFFWRGARKVLWLLFGVLFVSGVVWQILAFKSFVTSTHLP